jgi:hypothetical protein
MMGTTITLSTTVVRYFEKLCDDTQVRQAYSFETLQKTCMKQPYLIMNSSSRKRRINEVIPLEDDLQKVANKKLNRNDGNGITVEADLSVSIQTALPVSEDETKTVPLAQNTTAKIITPHSSFHEIRRVSVLSGEVDSMTTHQMEQSTVSETSSQVDDEVMGIFNISEGDEAIRAVSVATTSAAGVLVIEPPSSRVSPIDGLVDPLHPRGPTEQPKEIVESVKLDGLKPHTQQYSHGWVAVILVTLLFVYSCFASTPVVLIDDPNSIYVPGGGFSGFWFTLGRLNSIEDPLNHRYYCYSAGCLGVATMLSRVSMEDAYGYAVGAQKHWQRGELSRYDVTESFIDALLYTENQTLRPVFADDRVLSSMRIITSERNSYMGVKAAIRTPTNHHELKDMLLQTAWIPFAISRDLWYSEHMDGAFTLHSHPRCQFQLGYDKWEWDLMINALNVNLGYNKVQQFWQRGLQLGLQR